MGERLNLSTREMIETIKSNYPHSGYEMLRESLDRCLELLDLVEKGSLVEIKCHCKDCVHIDCSGCVKNTMYCMKHGCYMSGYDGFCAEARKV